MSLKQNVHVQTTVLGRRMKNNVLSVTLGEGGWFSSSEKEGEQGFRRLREGLGVAGGEGDGVLG